MSIASNLRREMDEKGVSIETAAGQICADVSSVRKYLSGKIRPSDGVLVRFSHMLGCTVEDLKFGRPRRRCGKLTTDEVARATGIDPLSLRIGLQRGFWPFGVAYKRPGSTQYTYEYFPEKIVAFISARNELRGGDDAESKVHLPGHGDRKAD